MQNGQYESASTCSPTDYDQNNLPEKEVVAEIGAELAIVGDPKKHSTIDLLERIRGGRGVSGGGSKAAKSSKPAPKRAPKAPARKSSARPQPVKKKSRAASEAHA